MLQEKFGDPIGSYAGDAPVGVRSVEESCAGCGLPVEHCECPDSGTCPVCGMMPVGGECGCKGLDEVDEDMKPCDECGMLEVEGSCGCTHMQEAQVKEVAPKGYENIVKALKKTPNVDNPWAIAWWMKSKGIKPKKKSKGKSK